ncbi:MAG: DUF3667 domain-containing protein [Xanthomonadales bacterium]|nr:DUF3667 domain-containing protein [Gammaproteobacteria bacterium]NNK05376.1 DUF3667 domain-containing protein [Xanthomonadales bacterium]
MSSNPETATEDNKQDESLPVVRSAAFTLAAKKLAGSGQCLNCGTDLKGPFCYYCGQPDRNFMRFFPALLRDLMEDVLDFDSRFMRTMKPLLFKPGRLTRDYMEGRRFRYTPPMRLYIFSSIVFFLLAAFLSSDAVSIKSVKNDGDIVLVTTETAVQQEKVEEALEKLPENIRPQVNVVEVLEESRQEDDDSGAFKIDDIQFNEEPWDRETNPVDIKWLPGWLNDRINEEIEESPQKAEQINENPNLIIDKVFDILPATMFVLLPVVALIFKFWYLFAKRYYVEHLIFSLHNHSFVFVSLFLILLANVAISMLNNSGDSAAATGMEWLVIVISVWIPLYLLVSLRVVYQQNWFMTIGKFSVIGTSYLTLLTFVTSGVAIASFVLL